MNSDTPGNRVDHEAAINALIDGELDEAGIERLRAAAADDRALAQAIVDAWRLQKSLDDLQLERAPSRLSRKLRRIPREQRRARVAWPRRVAAGAFASAVLAAFAMMMTVGDPSGEDALDTEQQARAASAARDLAIAFHYLDKVGLRAGNRIQSVLADEVAEPVTRNFSRHLPYTEQARKEKHS
ncbi:hypothetical protein [Elongatibacter sediminis]|uniref:Anti sigma-E protein RseA N-terminal domain-containing protein n=1 Tax=Elongatibacter sediminis TaxID=3119006 RepID=A0AAW9RA46_9GAMM